MSELTVKPAVELLSMLRDRSISCVELVQEHLQEIDRLNPTINAFVDVHPEEVLKAAAEADSLRRKPSNSECATPLLGLPCSIKSSIAVREHLCETGSLLHRGFRPAEDAEAVTRLRQAGAIILGTTNCPEFLMAYETDNLLYGPTRNPWNPEYQAGGSSGGESSAVAAGLSAGGLGSDSGGSVRIPAHFTGICSLKPTSGRISTAGHTLPCTGPFATLGALGPMARTIDDVSLLFGVLSTPTQTMHPTTRASLRGKPIGIFDDGGLLPITNETRDALKQAGDALKEQGFEIVPFASNNLEAAQRLWHEFFIRCGRVLLDPVVQSQKHELSPTFRYFLDYAAKQQPITASELLAAWAEADQLREVLVEELSHYTVILTPVSAIPAFRHGERSWQISDRQIEYFEAMQFTQWFNLLGAPAATVPVGRSNDNLPIGVQIASSPNMDETVLAVAKILDREFGYTAPPSSLAIL